MARPSGEVLGAGSDGSLSERLRFVGLPRTGSELDSELSMAMDLVTRRPNARLAPYVERYVGYRMTGFPAGVHRGLPSRHLTFIVSLDQPVEMLALPDPGQPPSELQAFVGGLHTRAALIRHGGNQHG